MSNPLLLYVEKMFGSKVKEQQIDPWIVFKWYVLLLLILGKWSKMELDLELISYRPRQVHALALAIYCKSNLHV